MMMGKRLSLVAALVVFFAASLGFAADGAVDFEKQVRAWDQDIAKIDKRIESGRTGSLEERDLRAQLKTIADGAAVLRDEALNQTKQSKRLLDTLGIAPAEDGTSESPAIQKRRKELSKEVADYEGRVKQAGLLIAKAEQALSKISLRSRERLKDALFERSVTPLNQKAWAIAWGEVIQVLDASLITAPGAWWEGVKGAAEKTVLLRHVSIALFVAIGGWVLGLWLRAHYGRVNGLTQPSYSRRLLAGLVEGGGRALGPILFVLLVSWLPFESDPAPEPLATVLRGLDEVLVLFFLGYGLINAGLTPQRQEWHLLNFEEAAARLLVFRLKLTLGTFLVLDGLRQITSWAVPSAELASVGALVFTLVTVPLLILLLDTRIWGQFLTFDRAPTSQEEITASTLLRARAFLTMGLIALPLIVLVGYSGLATYLLRALVLSSLVLAGMWLLRSVGREALGAALDPKLTFGRAIRNVFALDQEASTRTLFWLRVVFDFALLPVMGMVLLPVWGLGAEETAVSLGRLMRGINIGSYTLSLVDVVIGLALFATILFITRLIQKGLENHILPNLTKDKGVKDALKTGVGYTGTVVALLVTISALGLDLTNLALIAGALSVGIGFGLQNVVNNFVSGLILLAERPIKPGDWVVVGGHEGTVKKVNVRSTEIETFQRASVIIPNADLISSPVLNWTHKNILGRVEVLVGVAYGSDPQQVKAILLECAKAHPNVTAYPEPYVIFADFADSSLNFELRAYLANVEKRLHTGSDIRFAIHDAFKAGGIEIPFPQRVVHFPPGAFTGASAEQPKEASGEKRTETPVEVSTQSGPQDQPTGDSEATLETPSES